MPAKGGIQDGDPVPRDYQVLPHGAQGCPLGPAIVSLSGEIPPDTVDVRRVYRFFFWRKSLSSRAGSAGRISSDFLPLSSQKGL